MEPLVDCRRLPGTVSRCLSYANRPDDDAKTDAYSRSPPTEPRANRTSPLVILFHLSSKAVSFPLYYRQLTTVIQDGAARSHIRSPREGASRCYRPLISNPSLARSVARWQKGTFHLISHFPYSFFIPANQRFFSSDSGT